jgi:hypothetical protein
MPFSRTAMLALALLPLTGCQYVTYFTPESVDFSNRFGSSPTTVCEAMGAMTGDSSLDWCVADLKEARRARTEAAASYDSLYDRTPYDLESTPL